MRKILRYLRPRHVAYQEVKRPLGRPKAGLQLERFRVTVVAKTAAGAEVTYFTVMCSSLNAKQELVHRILCEHPRDVTWNSVCDRDADEAHLVMTWNTHDRVRIQRFMAVLKSSIHPK